MKIDFTEDELREIQYAIRGCTNEIIQQGTQKDFKDTLKHFIKIDEKIINLIGE